MQCVILAGGLGTRLGNRAGGHPKTLVPVAGHPFAHHQLGWLATQGVTEVVYCVGFGAGEIRAFVQDGRAWGLSIVFSDEGESLIGTGGALRLAYDAGLLADWFFVLYGDSWLTVDLSAVAATFLASDRPALMTVYRNDGSFDRSNVEFRAGEIALYDKSREPSRIAAMHHIDYGLLVLAREVVARLPATGVSDLADLLRDLSIEGSLAAFVVTERFFEVGTPSSLDELDRYLRSRGSVAP